MQSPATHRTLSIATWVQKVPLAWTVGCGLGALFFWAHPYAGIRHDGLLYTLQALRRLYPEALGGDLYFRYGSQDAFTVFSPVYAAFVRWTGVEFAAAAIAGASLVALFFAALVLAGRLMPPKLAGLAALFFVLVPGTYGAQGLLSYSENFVTPRPLAEALGLIGIALTLSGRGWLALLALLAGTALHPLMALPAMLAAGLCRAGTWPRRQQLAGAAVLGKILAVALILGAIGVLPRIDPAWRSVLAWQAPYLYADGWTSADWARAALVMASLATTLWACPPGRLRSLAAAAMAVGAAGLALGCCATWVVPVAALVQLQPWRWLWLAKAVAVLALAPTAGALLARGHRGYPVLALLALAWVAEGELLSIAASLCALATAVTGPRTPPWLGRTLIAAAAIAAAFWIERHGLSPRPLLAVLAVAGWWLALPERPLAARLTAMAIATCGLAVGVALMLRQPEPPNHDAAARALASWTARIRPDQTVLFLGNPAAAWLVLHRRSYASLSPGVYSRATALEVRARYDRYRAAVGTEVDWFHQGGWPAELVSPTVAQLADACALPDLDFVAGPLALPVPSLASSAAAPFSGLRLYDCRDLRRAVDPGPGGGVDRP